MTVFQKFLLKRFLPRLLRLQAPGLNAYRGGSGYTSAMFSFAFDMNQARRWGALCLATLGLHLVALNWADQHLSRPGPPPRPTETVQIHLRAAPVTTPAPTLPPIPAVVAASPPPLPPIPRTPPPRPARPAMASATVHATPIAEPAALPATIPVPVLPVPVPAEPVPAGNAATTQPTAGPVAEATPSAAPAVAPPPEAGTRGKTLRLRMPPSMELKYRVRKANSLTDTTGQTEGSGTMRWQNLGSQYRISAEAGIFFITLFSSQSEGEITDTGIAPLLYTRKTPKITTNTHFQRGRNVISFSASTREYPRQEGAQDQTSMIFQLAAIGLGNSEQISEDNLIEFVVASEREAELWQFRVISMEKILLDNKEVLVWHLQRSPSVGSFTSKFDIWLSPAHQWAPVHILQTDSKGGIIEMVMSKFTLSESEH